MENEKKGPAKSIFGKMRGQGLTPISANFSTFAHWTPFNHLPLLHFLFIFTIGQCSSIFPVKVSQLLSPLLSLFISLNRSSKIPSQFESTLLNICFHRIYLPSQLRLLLRSESVGVNWEKAGQAVRFRASSMGICFSARIKAVSTCSTGTGGNLTGVSRDPNDLSSSSSNSKFSSTSISRSEDEILQSSNLKSFSFSELKLATRNFRPDSLLGEGGFGSVYKGWIDEHSSSAAKPGYGTVVAVKRLNLEGLQGHKEWLAEVNFLGQLHHSHLVRLIGYCLEDEHRLLVYEFLPRGSLENHLFRRGLYFQPLSWSLRLKIALGAAKGLAFLHSDENKVIYRDFKTSNILLDSNYNAKLSDFGLAKDGPTGDKSHVSTRIMGTYGYAAPEYLATGHLSAKSDVYSFGVVLLEILSGRRAIDKNRPLGEQNLVEWAKPFLANKRKAFRLLDARIERNYPMESAFRVAILASRCLSAEPKFRPSMSEIVTTLKDLQDSKGTGPTGNRRSRTCKQTSATGNARKEVSAYPRPSASALFT